MQAEFIVSKNLRFTVNADTQFEMFEQLAALQEVFAETTCRACGSEDTSRVVRTNDDGSFCEVRCNKCRAKLDVGTHKKGGGLYVKKTKDGPDGNKVWKDNGGWEVWNKLNN